MRVFNSRLLSSFIAAAAFGGILYGTSRPSLSQENSNGVLVAVSDRKNDHIHSFAIARADLDATIAGLTNDDDSIQIEASTGFDGGTTEGVAHTHIVILEKKDLVQLRDSGSIRVESETNFGHKHTFEFIREEQCPGVAIPVVPNPSPVPSPSGSPSPSPSGSPSPDPSGSPSPDPTITQSPTPTESPFPFPSFTIPPFPDLPSPF